MFNAQRLSLARRRRRLSGKGLAELVGVSPVTISRLEKGNNEPDPDTVAAISESLGFPVEFFFGGDVDMLSQEAASFRSLTAMTAKERDAALSAGTLAFMLSDWVDARFNLPPIDLLDLGHESDPGGAAVTLRQHWGLGEQPIRNMLKLLEAKGVRVFSLAENTANVDAFSVWRDEVPYVFLNTMKSSEHSRFDAAHELGHLVLHRHGAPNGRAAENEANQFASSFLMPSADVLGRVRRISSIDQLIDTKRRWGVSVAALAYRLHKLQVLSDWQYRTFCIQINKLGYRKSEPKGLAREGSVVWKKVLSALWAEKVTRTHIAQDLSVPVEEIEGLLFGITHGDDDPVSTGPHERIPLQVIS